MFRRLMAALVLLIGISFAASPTASGAGVVIGDHSMDNPCGSGAQSAGCQDSGGVTQNTVIRGAITLLQVIGGIVGVIFVIIGGFKYVTSAGDPGKAEEARNTIIYAVVGLLVLTIASAIIGFVINRL